MPAGRWRRPALSLRWRLAGWVAGVMLSCAAVVFVVVYLNTGSQLRGQIDRDIASDTAQLSQSLRALRGRDSAKLLAAAERYMRAQPYRATSTLLFVLGPGGSLASNHPELFRGPRPEGSETPAEQAHENAEASRLRTPRLGYSVQEVPDVGRVRVLEHRLPDGGGVVVGAGEPLALVEQAQHGVARAFAIAGAIVLALALLASYLAAARITAPLRRMASVAARVDAGDLAPRMDASPRLAGELGVLTTAFNHMLDRLAEAFAAQREFIADASHELRTPLTVIRGQLEVLVAQEDPPVEEVRRVERLVQAEVTRISRLVDDLLVLAQSERTDFLRREEIELRSFVAELWDGLSLTARRRFELGPVPAGTLHADPDRVAQALRNLARNAIEHTAEPDGLVRLEVRRSAADGVRFTVIDDGPGIPAAERERVFERLHRLDAARSRAAGGAGLGLAIVRAVAEAHGGRVSAAEAPAGGAQIDLVLPGFAPAR
jgi:signal transduction histidine kinase